MAKSLVSCFFDSRYTLYTYFFYSRFYYLTKKQKKADGGTNSFLNFEVGALYKQCEVIRHQSTGTLYQLIITAGLGLGQHTTVQLANVLHVHALDVAGKCRHTRLQHRLQSHLRVRQVPAPTHTHNESPPRQAGACANTRTYARTHARTHNDVTHCVCVCWHTVTV